MRKDASGGAGSNQLRENLTRSRLRRSVPTARTGAHNPVKGLTPTLSCDGRSVEEETVRLRRIRRYGAMILWSSSGRAPQLRRPLGARVLQTRRTSTER